MKTAIHTVIYNELDEYLKSWLNHHTKMVDHIFIFEDVGSHSHKHVTDQYSNVTLMSVFDLYTEDGKKRLVENKSKKYIMQTDYILHGVTMIQELNEYDWCFCLDIDEFITLQEPYKSIPDVLSEFQDYDAVLLQWMNFGANGRISKPNYEGRDYREFYTKRADDSKWDNQVKANTKICFNLSKTTKWHLCGVHCCAGNWVKTNFLKQRATPSYDKMYLAHYITRSWEEYLWKIYKRGMHCGSWHRKDKDFFEINKDMQDKYDECMMFKENYVNNIN
jgi:hypothetical protein